MRDFLEPELKVIIFKTEDILTSFESNVDIDPDTGLPVLPED